MSVKLTRPATTLVVIRTAVMSVNADLDINYTEGMKSLSSTKEPSFQTKPA